jgi:hypothetical protein
MKFARCLQDMAHYGESRAGTGDEQKCQKWAAFDRVMILDRATTIGH